MATGKAHASITLTQAATGAACFALCRDWEDAVYFNGGVLLGLLLSPDLDLIAESSGQYSMEVWRKSLGRGIGSLIAIIWRGYWWLYSKAVPHRSYLSHGLIIGSALRVMYVITPVVVAILAGWDMPRMDWRRCGIAFCGLCLADAGHLAGDT